MSYRNVLITLVSLVVVALCQATHANAGIVPSGLATVSLVQKARVTARVAGLPLSFEPNQGQSVAGVKFLAHGKGYGLFLTGTEAVLTLPGRPNPRPFPGSLARLQRRGA
jgi:hypothetical protein